MQRTANYALTARWNVSQENINKWPPLLLRSSYLHDYMFIKWTPIG